MSELLSRWLLIFAAVATRFMLRPFTMFLSLFQNPAELSFREEVNIFCDSCCGQLHQRRCNNSLYLGHLFLLLQKFLNTSGALCKFICQIFLRGLHALLLQLILEFIAVASNVSENLSKQHFSFKKYFQNIVEHVCQTSQHILLDSVKCDNIQLKLFQERRLRVQSVMS